MSSGRGILLKLTSVLVFMIMASLIKAASENVPPGEAVFFRSLFAMPTILVWLWFRGDLATGLRLPVAGGEGDTILLKTFEVKTE